jgi:hypothetical protein
MIIESGRSAGGAAIVGVTVEASPQKDDRSIDLIAGAVRAISSKAASDSLHVCATSPSDVRSPMPWNVTHGDSRVKVTVLNATSATVRDREGVKFEHADAQIEGVRKERGPCFVDLEQRPEEAEYSVDETEALQTQVEELGEAAEVDAQAEEWLANVEQLNAEEESSLQEAEALDQQTEEMSEEGEGGDSNSNGDGDGDGEEREQGNAVSDPWYFQTDDVGFGLPWEVALDRRAAGLYPEGGAKAGGLNKLTPETIRKSPPQYKKLIRRKQRAGSFGF